MAKSKPAPTAEPTPDAGLALARMQLSALTLSDLNPRLHVTEAEIDAMADSIAQLGLLQNLIGLQIDGDDMIHIVGGGKRLRAMQKLTRDGFLPKHTFDPVMVLITSDPVQAVAMAGAENIARTRLNHADEIQSYLSLSSRGLSTSAIAATYGQTEQHVRQMLKLAELPAAIMANLAAGKLSIDQTRAFTVARDDAAMINLLRAVLDRDLNPAQIRRALTPDTVSSSDWRVPYVGIEAYLAAGGSQIVDLFSDKSRLTDEFLLQKLFVAKGQAETKDLRAAEGWKWATFVPERWIDRALTSKLTALHRATGGLPEGDQDRLDALATTTETQDLTAEDQAEFESLRARWNGDYSDDDRATGGIFTTAKNGKLEIAGAYRRPGDAPQTIDPDTGAVITPTTEPKPHPQNLRDDLARIRLAAEQTALLGHPDMLLNLFAYSLLPDLYSWQRPLDLTLNPQAIIPSKPEGTTLDARLTPAQATGEPATSLGFAGFCALGPAHRDKVLTEALARSYRPGSGDMSDLIAGMIQPTPRAIWTPTAAGFLGRVSGDYLDALWTELTGLAPDDPAQTGFMALKKAGKAKELESLFADMSVREAMGLSRAQNAVIDAWLPPELQWGAA